MGGTPITVTVKEECVRFIDRMTCSFGDQTVPAVADTISPGHAYCTVPMMSTSGRIVFQFTVESKDGGKTSSYDNFYLCEYIHTYIHGKCCLLRLMIKFHVRDLFCSVHSCMEMFEVFSN